MRVEIRVNPVAAADLQEIKDYITQDNPDAAQKTVKSILSKIFILYVTQLQLCNIKELWKSYSIQSSFA